MCVSLLASFLLQLEGFKHYSGKTKFVIYSSLKPFLFNSWHKELLNRSLVNAKANPALSALIYKGNIFKIIARGTHSF